MATGFGAVSAVLFLIAGEYDIGSFLEPSLLLGSEGHTADLVRWAALTDMFGYYLLLIPLFVVTGMVLRRSAGPIVDLLTVAGLMYVVIGAIAAVVLATVAPPLIDAFHDLDPQDQRPMRLAFTTLVDAVYKGAWQTLEVIPLGAWAIGTGSILKRAGRTVGIAGMAAGSIALLGSLCRMLELDLTNPVGYALFGAAGVLLTAYFIGLALWLSEPEPTGS